MSWLSKTFKKAKKDANRKIKQLKMGAIAKAVGMATDSVGAFLPPPMNVAAQMAGDAIQKEVKKGNQPKKKKGKTLAQRKRIFKNQKGYAMTALANAKKHKASGNTKGMKRALANFKKHKRNAMNAKEGR